MSSFLPIPECQQQEVQAIQQQLCHQPIHMPWPTVDNEPLNEYLTPFLATLDISTISDMQAHAYNMTNAF